MLNLDQLDVNSFTKDNPSLVSLTNSAPTLASHKDSLSNCSPLTSNKSSYNFDSRIFTFSKKNNGRDDDGDGDCDSNDRGDGSDWVSDITSNNDEAQKYLEVKKDQVVIIRFSNSPKPVLYQYQKNIAQGAYGQVIWYQATDLKLAKKLQVPIDLCLKVGLKLGDLDADMGVLSAFDNNITPEFIVPTRAVYVKINDTNNNDIIQPILIMPKMDGTLKQLINSRITFHNIYDKYWLASAIIYSLNMIFYQLIKKRIYYTDIKISNILYQLKDDATLIICLGDLGSAYFANDREAIATFPNICRSRCHNFTPICYDLVYGLMVILFEIMTTGPKEGPQTYETLDRELLQHLFHENIKELTLEQRHNIIKQIFANLETLESGALIEKFLKTVKDKCYTNANKQKTADTAKNLKNLLPVWQTFYQKFSQESKLANTITIRLGC